MFKHIFLSVVVVFLASQIVNVASWAQPPACDPPCGINASSNVHRGGDQKNDNHPVQQSEQMHVGGKENKFDRGGNAPKKQDAHTGGDYHGMFSSSSPATTPITAPMLDRNQMNPQGTAPTCSLC
ncbi:hypothetical protein [Petrachloros mirabilis]